MKRVEILIVFAIVGVLAWMLLPVLQNEYVPTKESLETLAVTKPFQVQPSDFEGLYGNYDIDALVFRYRTHCEDKVSFESQLDSQAASDGWTKMPSQDGAYVFERISPKGSGVFCGAEQARVKLDPDDQSVTVGWVQGDTSTDVSSFSQASEATWAEKEVWPKLR